MPFKDKLYWLKSCLFYEKTPLFYVIWESMQTALYNPYTNKTGNDHEAGVIRDGSFGFIQDDYYS